MSLRNREDGGARKQSQENCLFWNHRLTYERWEGVNISTFDVHSIHLCPAQKVDFSVSGMRIPEAGLEDDEGKHHPPRDSLMSPTASV